MSWVPIRGSEWLSLTDAVIAGEIPKVIAKAQDSNSLRHLRALEVGVYKGAWTASVLANNPKVQLCGVDPYPKGYEHARKKLMDRIHKMGLGTRYTHLDHTSQVTGRFELIHIDGNHEEKAFADDLKFAVALLENFGILVVDDVRHPWFPGIAYGLYSAISTSSLSVLIDTGNKIYLCHEKNHGALIESALLVLQASNLDVRSSLARNKTGIGSKKHTVKGRGLLFVRHRSKILTFAHKLASWTLAQIRIG